MKRYDPSRTGSIRRRFEADMKRRLKKIKQALQEFLVADDALGLAPKAMNPVLMQQVPKRAYAFLSNPQKIDQFNLWFNLQLEENLLRPIGGDPGRPWTAEYVEGAYQKGLINAYTDVHKESLADSLDFYEGTKYEFIRSSMNAPVTLDELKILNTRALESLKGVSGDMASSMNRILTEGLLKGTGPYAIAREMSKKVDGIGRKRAIVIARTEIANAQAEGQLNGFEKLGIEKIGLQIEWLTVGDEACPLCQDASREGPFTIEQARGLIPFHPNCRCAWTPAVEEPEEKKEKPKPPQRLPAKKSYRWYPKKPQKMLPPAKPKKVYVPKVIPPSEKPLITPPPKPPKKTYKMKPKGANSIGIQGVSKDARIPGRTFDILPDKLGGSTGAKLVNVRGHKFVMKQYKMSKSGMPELQARNEFVANRLLRSMKGTKGGRVPLSYLGKVEGKAAVFNKFEEGLRTINNSDLAWLSKKLEDDFVTHAWLANWDVAGLSMDNIMIKGKSAFYLDNGGALMFRAQGGLKGSYFDGLVTELDTLRNASKNPSAFKLFGHISDKRLVKLIDDFEAHFKAKVGHDGLRSIIASAGFDAKTQTELMEKLGQRYGAILKYRETLKARIAARKTAKKVLPKFGKAPAGVYTKVASMEDEWAAKWDAKLRPGQKQAVRSFTGSYSGEMNYRARQVAKGEAELTRTMVALDKALDGSTPRFQGQLWRGISAYPEKAAKKWQTGEWAYAKWDAYSSTSVFARRAFNPGPKGTLFIINQKGAQSGGFVKPISSHGSEYEYLLGRQVKYRVVGYNNDGYFEWDGGKTAREVYILEEVDINKIPDQQVAPTYVTKEQLHEMERFADNQ